MQDRLRSRDLGFLAQESATTPMHNATLEIFEVKDSGFGYDALVALIADRIAFVPRYRQLLRRVPGRLANPLWVDDPHFDLAFHVRRSALPQPGDDHELSDLVARIVARPLDRNRPLWEVYVIEGLSDGRIAVLSKSHQILVDGVETVDIGQVLLDVKPEPKLLLHDDWTPRPTQTGAALAAGAITESILHPSVATATARATADSLSRTAKAWRNRAREVSGAATGRKPSRGPVVADLSEHRRIVTVRTDLDDYRLVRRTHGGSVNDVILATITGAFRGWAMTRPEGLGARRTLKAIVPMSVIDEELEATSLGTAIAGHLVRLPVGEQSPVIRLHQVSYAFKGHRETGRAVAANRLAGIAGFAPTTFHALGSRVAAEQAARHGFHLSITNVPGPQFPLYAAGAEMIASYPVHPLLPGHAMAIGVTSYNGWVHYGVTADHDALPDVQMFGQCLVEALDELVESCAPERRRVARGKRKPGPRTLGT